MFAKAGNNNSIQASLIRRISAAVLSAACLAMLTVACSRSSGITLNYSDHDPLGGMRTQFVKDVLLAGIVEQGGGKIGAGLLGRRAPQFQGNPERHR